MRRPKAAIPILPPPENQHQTSRGRGRSTQPQQTNQHGNTQQTEQEVKSNSVEGDQKTVPEQFDNTQIEQEYAPEIQETEKTDDLSAITNPVVENTEKDIKNLDIEVPVNLEDITTNQLDDISANDLSKVTINEEDAIPLKIAEPVIEEPENDSNKIENTTTESTVVGEATA